MREASIGAVGRGALLLLALGLSACAAVDASYAPRTDQVTRDVGDQRDRNTFLNIIRASRFDTLNFTTLAKYTAGGSLQLSTNVLTRGFAAGASLPADTFGPNSAQGIVTNSFDLGSLENGDFYSGLLSAVPIEKVHFFLGSGLRREILMHAVIDSIEVQVRGRHNYRVYNDPTNDVEPVDASLSCRSIQNGRAFVGFIWFEPNSDRCLYQKFRLMLRFALQHGITTQALPIKPVPNLATKDGSKPEIKASLCFDPSLATPSHSNGRAEPTCEAPKSEGQNVLRFPDEPAIVSATPIFRSTYGIFQFFGSIVRGGLADRAILVQDPQHPVQIFPFTIDGGDCFVSADGYCIPNGIESANAKQLIALLNALVALDIKPSALPITPTVQLSPGL